MGVRLEWVVGIAIVAIVSGVMVLKPKSMMSSGKEANKEIQFTDTTLLEVDVDGVLVRSYNQYGVRINGILTVENLLYHTKTIESLVAKSGRLEGDMLYLDGDIVLQEKAGYRFETQRASYDKKNEILSILTPFVAHRAPNSMSGDTLEYDMQKKEAFGTTIKSIVYTTEK